MILSKNKIKRLLNIKNQTIKCKNKKGKKGKKGIKGIKCKTINKKKKRHINLRLKTLRKRRQRGGVKLYDIDINLEDDSVVNEDRLKEYTRKVEEKLVSLKGETDEIANLLSENENEIKSKTELLENVTKKIENNDDEAELLEEAAYESLEEEGRQLASEIGRMNEEKYNLEAENDEIIERFNKVTLEGEGILVSIQEKRAEIKRMIGDINNLKTGLGIPQVDISTYTIKQLKDEKQDLESKKEIVPRDVPKSSVRGIEKTENVLVSYGDIIKKIDNLLVIIDDEIVNNSLSNELEKKYETLKETNNVLDGTKEDQKDAHIRLLSDLEYLQANILDYIGKIDIIKATIQNIINETVIKSEEFNEIANRFTDKLALEEYQEILLNLQNIASKEIVGVVKPIPEYIEEGEVKPEKNEKEINEVVGISLADELAFAEPTAVTATLAEPTVALTVDAEPVAVDDEPVNKFQLATQVINALLLSAKREANIVNVDLVMEDSTAYVSFETNYGNLSNIIKDYNSAQINSAQINIVNIDDFHSQFIARYSDPEIIIWLNEQLANATTVVPPETVEATVINEPVDEPVIPVEEDKPKATYSSEDEEALNKEFYDVLFQIVTQKAKNIASREGKNISEEMVEPINDFNEYKTAMETLFTSNPSVNVETVRTYSDSVIEERGNLNHDINYIEDYKALIAKLEIQLLNDQSEEVDILSEKLKNLEFVGYLKGYIKNAVNVISELKYVLGVDELKELELVLPPYPEYILTDKTVRELYNIKSEVEDYIKQLIEAVKKLVSRNIELQGKLQDKLVEAETSLTNLKADFEEQLKVKEATIVKLTADFASFIDNTHSERKELDNEINGLHDELNNLTGMLTASKNASETEITDLENIIYNLEDDKRSLETELGNLQTQIVNLTTDQVKEKEDLEAKVSALQDNINGKDVEINEKNVEITRIREENDTLKLANTGLQAENTGLLVANTGLQVANTGLKVENTGLKEKIDSLKTNVRDLNNQLDNVTEEKEELLVKKNELEDEVNTLNDNNQLLIDALTKVNEQFENFATLTLNDKTRLEGEKLELEEQIAKQNLDLEALTKQVNQLTGQLNEKDKKMEELKQEILLLKDVNERLRQELDEYKSEVAMKDSTIVNLNSNLVDSQNRLNLIQTQNTRLLTLNDDLLEQYRDARVIIDETQSQLESARMDTLTAKERETSALQQLEDTKRILENEKNEIIALKDRLSVEVSKVTQLEQSLEESNSLNKILYDSFGELQGDFGNLQRNFSNLEGQFYALSGERLKEALKVDSDKYGVKSAQAKRKYDETMETSTKNINDELDEIETLIRDSDSPQVIVTSNVETDTTNKFNGSVNVNALHPVSIPGEREVTYTVEHGGETHLGGGGSKKKVKSGKRTRKSYEYFTHNDFIDFIPR
jgi:chromosome segregation ATPase